MRRLKPIMSEKERRERKQLRKSVNEYCVERLRDEQLCRDCVGNNCIVCVKADFFKKDDIKTVRAEVKKLLNGKPCQKYYGKE